MKLLLLIYGYKLNKQRRGQRIIKKRDNILMNRSESDRQIDRENLHTTRKMTRGNCFILKHIQFFLSLCLSVNDDSDDDDDYHDNDDDDGQDTIGIITRRLQIKVTKLYLKNEQCYKHFSESGLGEACTYQLQSSFLKGKLLEQNQKGVVDSLKNKIDTHKTMARKHEWKSIA